ncbi:MAG: glycine cleavage system protein R [Colwellia sp.]
MHHLVISCIGEDKKGLVESLSQVISLHHGNWKVSSLHHLSGYFAGVIQVDVSAEHSEKLIESLKGITGLQCDIRLAEDAKKPEEVNLTLEITANDRAGIIQEVSAVIHQQGGNLVKLVSTQESAAHSGQLMFKAKAQVSINDEAIDDIIEAIENIGNDLIVDISR